MNDETRAFHIGDVITITDGHLVSPDHVSGIYKILDWMTGESLMTHQLPRVADECKPYLAAQFPDLSTVKVPPTVNSQETADAFLETLYPRFGQFVEVAKIPETAHEVIDPIAELQAMRPDAGIITVSAGMVEAGTAAKHITDAVRDLTTAITDDDIRDGLALS